MIESKVDRIRRFERATNLVAFHPLTSNFRSLISGEPEAFAGFRAVYATDHIDTEVCGVSLAQIEEECPPLSRYFGASGILFYADDLYKETNDAGVSRFPIDYSVSFDTQVAEAFRCYEAGRGISDWTWFSSLVRFVKLRDFNFDYSFYMVEDLRHALDLENRRPFETVRALKRFDHLDLASFELNPSAPVFLEDRESAGRRAVAAISSFLCSNEVKKSTARRKGLQLVLLKAVLLIWRQRGDPLARFGEVVSFSLTHLGKFAKLELYFAWKLIKHGGHLRFFAPLLQPSEKALAKVRGMSWDLYSIRHQEMMSTYSGKARFYIPFIATLDRRFKELIEACPIRCVLLDDREKLVNTIFFDETEFFSDLVRVTDPMVLASLRDPGSKVARASAQVMEGCLDSNLVALENECRQLFGS